MEQLLESQIQIDKPISKKQQKKQARKIKQQEHYKEKKILKKQIQKEKKQQQQQQPQSQNIQKIEQKENIKQEKKRDKEYYKENMKNSITIIIDLQFMNEMTIQEKTSLYKQIELCHSINYKAQKPLNLIVTSLTNDFLQLLNKSNAQNWGIGLEQKSYIEFFNQEQLIYLTGDTENVLDTLKQDNIYIIGGLVDHNRLKNITYNKAIEQGIQTNKLPINLELKTSSILTVNQVFEILLRVNNGEDWNQSISNSIPQRKFQKQ